MTNLQVVVKVVQNSSTERGSLASAGLGLLNHVQILRQGEQPRRPRSELQQLLIRCPAACLSERHDTLLLNSGGLLET